MKLHNQTILITGGGSGIGLALAQEFAKLDNQVIIAGRSPEKLKIAKSFGFKTISVDMTDAKSIQTLASKVTTEFPNLNVVIHNAGIMKPENIVTGGNQKTQEETISTNLLGPIRLTEALLPHFLKKDNAVIMTVTSGLAFIPLAMTPTYCATKAALHSYTESLRYQLKDTAIKVIELAPPYVQTTLMGENQSKDPHAMPLNDFIFEVMQILKQNSLVQEILVERVKPLRLSGDKGRESYQEFFKQFNDAMSASRK